MVNAAPYSFFNVFSDNPVVVAIGCAARAPGTPKDTLANIEATGQFVVNLVSAATVEADEHHRHRLRPGVGEITEAGLTAVPSTKRARAAHRREPGRDGMRDLPARPRAAGTPSCWAACSPWMSATIACSMPRSTTSTRRSSTWWAACTGAAGTPAPPTASRCRACPRRSGRREEGCALARRTARRARARPACRPKLDSRAGPPACGECAAHREVTKMSMTAFRPSRRAVLALAAALPSPALAQAFPDRPLRLVIPWPPGGTNDIVGRMVDRGHGAAPGPALRDREPRRRRRHAGRRGGREGRAGRLHPAARRQSGGLTITSWCCRRLPFDLATAFAPVGMIGAAPNVDRRPSLGLPATHAQELQRVASRPTRR